MDLTSEPPQKRRKISNDVCIICERPLDRGATYKTVVRNPTRDGILTFLRAAEQRKDDVFNCICPSMQDILDGHINIAFHVACRASYTSKQNITGGSSDSPLPSTSQSGDDTERTGRLRRSETSQFDIRKDCFICGRSQKRNEKLTSITTGTGSSTRQRVLNAAEARNDHQMRLRMLAYPDLFAYDAKYHRSCYGHYISE